MAGGPPLAVAFANTRRRRGTVYRDLLGSGADLAAWAEREAVPAIEAEAADARLDDVRALRDEVASLLKATAAGDPAPPAERINAALRAVPLVPQLEPDGHTRLQAA